MCVKLPLGDLNPDPCPPHPTSIYTCGVTTASRVRGVLISFLVTPSLLVKVEIVEYLSLSEAIIVF